MFGALLFVLLVDRRVLVVVVDLEGPAVAASAPDYQNVRNANVALGDFFTAQQLDAKSSVIVLGATVADTLFPDADPTGQAVRVATSGSTGASFTVIGVMVAKGGTGFGNADDQVFVPITTLETRLSSQRTTQGGSNVGTIDVQVVDSDSIAAAEDQVTAILEERHRTSTPDFTIQNQADLLAAATQVTGTLTALLGAIAGISLVVGGIGIMNIMLVSVTERTHEIGIRKAIGARRRDILAQFLTEANLISAAGGAIGVGLGVLASRLISSASLSGQSVTTVVSLDSILLAFLVSAAIGVFFGIYPVIRAARLNPIEALRYE